MIKEIIMRKGIWQEFDGYQDIVDEIKVSRKLGCTVSAAVVAAEEYIRQLHPERMELCVADIIEETSSTKTLRLVSRDNYLPPFLAVSTLPSFLKSAAFARAALTVYLLSPIKSDIMISPSGGLKMDWFPTICSMKSNAVIR
jgi:hypothetical protein